MAAAERVIIGIESSCDETAVAVLTETGRVLSHEMLSQLGHANFGGVVPEIAARAHFDVLPSLVACAMEKAKVHFSGLEAIAVTAGPGLVGSLIVGIMFAKAVAFASGKPIIAVNHLEAHALVARMVNDISFPFLVLIISGGHCQFLLVRGVGKYEKLGSSIDDSLGEAFDKVSKMLGLSYPGGPIVERSAAIGRGDRFCFPRAMRNREGCDFSFSGLKTAVRNVIAAAAKPLDEQFICDVCASFQECVSDILASRIQNAIKASKMIDSRTNKIVVTGGVASNSFLRRQISICAEEVGFEAIYPPPELCTDNGIMVGWAGIENLRVGNVCTSLSFPPKARWPLESLSRA